MVVSSLKRQVASLKTQAGGGGGGCNHCGGDDGSGGGGGPYTIYFDDEVPDDFEDVCPKCGEVYVIYFDDDPRAPSNVQ
jgi:hypothetical protein